MASTSGTMKTSSITIVITTTAGARLPPSQPCMRSIIGQVATTIVMAQMKEARNGRRTQNEASVRPPMKSTLRVTRPMSPRGSFMTHLPPRLPSILQPDRDRREVRADAGRDAVGPAELQRQAAA